MSNQGWRFFKCDECIKGWAIMSRDHTSNSVDTCPECGDDLRPVKSVLDLSVKVDQLGNLVERKHKEWTVEEDIVNHPKHYTKHPSGVECIDICEHMSFCAGNAMKYLWRHKDKGNPIVDLQKADWYIKREILRLEKQNPNYE